jgi:Uma2 family endonuclease
MADPLRKPAGWAELVAAPAGLEAEVIGGELWTHPRPRPEHGRAQGALTYGLFGAFDFGRGGPGGWWLIPEVDVAFGPHDIVSPDLAGWRRERGSEFPRERPIRVHPDWVCEVLSPSTQRRDRLQKAQLYLEGGVQCYWLVDTDARLLEAFEAQEGRWVRLGAWGDEDVARVPPFGAVELTVGDLFLPAAPDEGESPRPVDPAGEG